MATVQISDVFVPAVYESYGAENLPEKTAFWSSGVIVRDPLLDTALSNGGIEFTTPYWGDLDPTVEPNYSTDDPTTQASPHKITSSSFRVRKAMVNQGYSASDLARELTSSDPMARIKGRFDTYWARQIQRRLIASCMGIMAANIAQNGGDMVKTISIADGNAASSANLFSRTAFTGAAFTMGDAWTDIAAIAVHSIVMKRMIDNDDIDFIPDSLGHINIPTYLGKPVIVDDSMPVVAGGTSGFIYTSILFGAGAIGYGETAATVPAEVYRNPQGGNGGGIEELWERKSWVIAPAGFDWTETTVTGESPTLANLKLAANWSRKFNRKNIPISFLQTNG